MTRKEEIERLVETSAPVFEETSDKIWGFSFAARPDETPDISAGEPSPKPAPGRLSRLFTIPYAFNSITPNLHLA